MSVRKKLEMLRMKREAERILKELEKHPELDELVPPPDMKERIYAEIERREQECKNSLTEEQKELIQMGLRYKKNQKHRKLATVAVLIILLLSIGMTSLGGAEKVFYRISSMFMNRGREVVDSGGVEIIDDYSEEEIYAEIEEKLGFYPVKMGYKPEGTLLMESAIYLDMPGVHMIYGNKEIITMAYWIRPNYLDGSLSKDYEDEIVEEKQLFKDNIVIDVKEYFVDDEGTRWLIEFEYKDVFYSIYTMNISEAENDTIIQNLFFY